MFSLSFFAMDDERKTDAKGRRSDRWGRFNVLRQMVAAARGNRDRSVHL
jgi:hypothetical protein